MQVLAAIASNCSSLRELKLRERSDLYEKLSLTDVFKANPQLRTLGLWSSVVTTDEVLGIACLASLKVLTLGSVEGLTDDVLCAIAPKLPLLERIEVSCNADITNVGASAFATYCINLSECDVFSSDRLEVDPFIEAVASNRALCNRLKYISISSCSGTVKPNTLRALGLRCSKLTNFSLDAPATPYPQDIVRLFPTGCLNLIRGYNEED